MEKCKICGIEKEMYYSPICFYCEPPKIETVKRVNLFCLLYYLEKNGHPGIKDRVCDTIHEIQNDSLIVFDYPDKDQQRKFSG